MRITEAAQRLGTSPRMLRYRDSLGLLPAVREHRPARRLPRRPAGPPHLGQPAPPRQRPGQPPSAAVRDTAPAQHRRFDEHDLDAVGLALAIERRYDITPAALAFGLRVLTEPTVRAEVADLGRRIGRIQAPTARALDFEQERALRLLSMSPRPVSPCTSRAPPDRRAPQTTSMEHRCC
jgi:MerR family transcriptional regulator, copper efflux regulator